jgi:serine/threonine protein kinase
METTKTRLDNEWKTVDKKYIITKTLGQSEFGQVMKGHNRLTGDKVAIKHVVGFMNDSAKYKKVIREIEIMKQLS